jgi:hypothetical protein
MVGPSTGFISIPLLPITSGTMPTEFLLVVVAAIVGFTGSNWLETTLAHRRSR